MGTIHTAITIMEVTDMATTAMEATVINTIHIITMHLIIIGTLATMEEGLARLTMVAMEVATVWVMVDILTTPYRVTNIMEATQTGGEPGS